MTPLPTMLKSSATFSPCERYRYDLRRVWDTSKPTLAVIGLNPSTADEINNDPTVTRCIVRANMLGYGSLIMLNIFAFRATDPEVMLAVDDPIGPDNDDAIRHHCYLHADTILAAWGCHGLHRSRHVEVTKMITMPPVSRMLNCLGVNKNGQPKHPLYVSYETPLQVFKMRVTEQIPF